MRRWGLGCLVVVLAGVAALAWSTLPVIPDCDGLTMGPDDRCIVLEGGIGRDEGTYGYDDAVRGERRSRHAARVGGWALVAAGVTAFGVGAWARRRETARRDPDRHGPGAVARQVAAADLGSHVCSVALHGDRTLHLHRAGVVVERRDHVEDVVAWRDLDELHPERRTGPDGQAWVHSCVLVTGARRVKLRARPDDHATLTALTNLATATPADPADPPA